VCQAASSALQALLLDGKFTGSWTLDASRSEVRLKTTSMWGLAPVKGVFRQVAGNGTVTPDGDVTGTITVTAASIDTKTKKRDQHLRSADFFDVDNYPLITFAVHQVKPSGSGVTVVGSLTVRGRTRPVSFVRRRTRRARDRGVQRGDCLPRRYGHQYGRTGV
jgi:polyisoprenoid-binding protein YceI